jgi:osmotically inducible protein OsmC
VVLRRCVILKKEEIMEAIGLSTWKGTWKQGFGTISTKSEIVKDEPYTFASRFEGAAGASPEEFLAAAHAGCFNQALANNFGMIGMEAESIATSVTIAFGHDVGGTPAINSSHITVTAKAPGITADQFAHCAERARSNCTISKLVKCEITMTATLIL